MTPARAGACALPRWRTCGGTHSAALGRASDARITLRVAERLQPKPLGSATLKRRQPTRGQADMKNRFLASVALAAMIAAPATAADLPYKAPPPLPEAYYDWSGAYVGLNVGGTHYSDSTSAGRTTTSLTISRRREPSLPTSRPATTTPSSESTPARNGSGALGFSARN